MFGWESIFMVEISYFMDFNSLLKWSSFIESSILSRIRADSDLGLSADKISPTHFPKNGDERFILFDGSRALAVDTQGYTYPRYKSLLIDADVIAVAQRLHTNIGMSLAILD